MHKERIELHVMWHVNGLMHTYPVTLVTSIDEEGRVNAAPYSLVMPFCSSPKNPQMILIANKNWHTAKNIEQTGEFVLNYPGAHQIQDINETARFHPEGVNELNHTGFTTMPSQFVRPPKIVECYQHVECRVAQIIRPSQTQVNFIAQVLDVSIDKGLHDMPRADRARKVNGPVFLGVDEEQRYVFGTIDRIETFPVDLQAGN
jgi:flavin reductase (DIM6/NTAB) family NADH-FMN oxidoreductase RutF